jgi:hypothetical protein
MVVAALLLAFAIQNLVEMRRESSTYDEIAKLTAGYTYLLKGDFRLNPLHPPFLKILSALPLLALHPKINFNDPSWQTADQWGFSSNFIYSNNADQLLFWGRLPVVLLALLLGFFVFRWAQRLYGSLAGVFALALYSFSPNIIAHSHFITQDAGVAALLTISLYFLWSYSQSGAKKLLFWSALFMGLAVASKYMAFAMLPCYLFLLWLVNRNDVGVMEPAARGSKKSVTAEGKNKLKGGKEGKISQTLRTAKEDAKPSTFFLDAKILSSVLLVIFGMIGLLGMLAFFHVLELHTVWKGLALVKDLRRPQFPFYWHGGFIIGGAWYSFLAMFLVKTTAGLLILIVIRLLMLMKNWRSEWGGALFLAMPALLYGVALSVFANPMSIRYLLPAYPLLMIFASGAVRTFARQRVAFWAMWLLLGWHVTSSLAAFPYPLSYFNEFVGGPSHGTDWLDESNVDWGQGLKELKTVLDEQHISSVTLMSFSPYDNPQYYGIQCTVPPRTDWFKILSRPNPGFYAISAHLLARAKGLGIDWQIRFPIVANAGNSMFVFQVP